MSHPRAASIVLVLNLVACGVKVEGDGVDATKADAPRNDAAIDAPVDARPCNAGDAQMVSPDGSCFFIFNTPATFANAQASCLAMSSHLAIIRNAQDDLVARTLVGTMRDAFIGLSDQATESQFLWVDGTATTFTNWYMLEPNNGNGGGYQEDCGVINGARGGLWDDRPCAPVPGVGGGSYPYVCQF